MASRKLRPERSQFSAPISSAKRRSARRRLHAQKMSGAALSAAIVPSKAASSRCAAGASGCADLAFCRNGSSRFVASDTTSACMPARLARSCLGRADNSCSMRCCR